MELVPIIDPDTLRLVGFADRTWAGTHGLCHLHVVLVPVFPGGRVAVQTRPAGRPAAGHHDFFGGHVGLAPEMLGILLGQPANLESIVRAAALREANEELRLVRGDGSPAMVAPGDLVMVDRLGAFLWDDRRGNVERSTLFLVPVPDGCALHKIDLIEGRAVAVEVTALGLDDLLAKYRTGAWSFDGGAARVLRRLTDDAAFHEHLARALQGVAAGP